jgi:uncharacterized protein
MGDLSSPAGRVTGRAPLMAGPRWRELTKAECFELLAREQLGRVAFVDDLGPLALPVNFVLDRYTVVFRTDEGSKLDASGGSRVAFEVDGTDAADQDGWSVLVRGEAVEVTDPAELERLRALPLRPRAPGAKRRYVRILPAALSGRRFSGAGRPPAGADDDGPGAPPARRR